VIDDVDEKSPAVMTASWSPSCGCVVEWLSGRALNPHWLKGHEHRSICKPHLLHLHLHADASSHAAGPPYLRRHERAPAWREVVQRACSVNSALQRRQWSTCQSSRHWCSVCLHSTPSSSAPRSVPRQLTTVHSYRLTAHGSVSRIFTHIFYSPVFVVEAL